MNRSKNLVALALLLCLTTLVAAVSAGPTSILPTTTGLNSHVTATGGSAPSPSQLLATISPLTGGLASQSTVQLDGQSTCTLATPANGCGKTTLSAAAVSTAATFRAGAVITGAGNPTAATVLVFNANFKFCFFVGAPQACSAATLWGAGAVVIFDANNNNVYDTGDIVVAGAAPPTGTAGFKPDGRIKFIDTTPANGLYDFGETVVADTSGAAGTNGSYVSIAADPYIGPSVFGWQFGLNYDPTLFIAQMDPCNAASPVCGPATGASTYADGAGADVVLGHQASSGAVSSPCPVYQRVSTNTGCNWDSAGTQGSIASSLSPGKIIVGLTYLAPTDVSLINGLDLLGTVAFELIKSGTGTISFSAVDTKFVDINANVIPYPIGVQSSVSVTVSNAPPVAAFTATLVNPPDPVLCPTLVAGACWRFDASASAASGTATLTNPTSYFWDFGDGLNDFGVTGPIVTHDFGITGTFDASLRVVDSNTATGSARDNNGAVIVNAQPSHTDHVVNAVPPASPTTTSVSCAPPSVAFGSSTTCTATVTDTSTTPTTPTGTVSFTSSGTGTFTGSPCTLAAGTTAGTATCFATYAPTGTVARTDTITASYSGDAGHSTSSGTFFLTVTTGTHSTTTTVSCPTTVFVNQGVTCTATVTDSTAPVTTPTGSVTFTVSGVTGTFTTCTLAAGTTAGTATCNTTFTPSTTGTASIVGTYGGDSGHTGSNNSATPAVVTVNKRTTSTGVTCTPSTVFINQGSTCTATVTDTAAGTLSTPTGSVTFTVSGVTGTFTTCTLAAGTTAGTATCTSTFTASTSGTATINGTYSSDGTHAVRTTTTAATVVVNLRTTTTSVTCTTPVVIGQGSTCTATVTDTAGATVSTPTGSVTLTVSGVTGTFTTCTLP